MPRAASGTGTRRRTRTGRGPGRTSRLCAGCPSRLQLRLRRRRVCGHRVGHHERDEHRPRPRRQRQVESRTGSGHAKREGQPAGEALSRLEVLLERPEALHRAELGPLHQSRLAPPGPGDELVAGRRNDPAECAGQRVLEPTRTLAQRTGDLVVSIETVGVVDRVQPEVIEVLALKGEVVGELVGGVLAVVAVIEERGEELVEGAAHRRLNSPAVEIPEERLGAAQVRRREDEQAARLEDPEDLLQRVKRIHVQVLEQLAEEHGVERGRRRREALPLDLAREDLDLSLSAALEEGRPSTGALDVVVEPRHFPAARLRQRRQVAGEGAHVEQAPPVTGWQEPKRVLVTAAVVVKVAHLPGWEGTPRETLDLARDRVEVDVEGRRLSAWPRPERHGVTVRLAAPRPAGPAGSVCGFTSQTSLRSCVGPCAVRLARRA